MSRAKNFLIEEVGPLTVGSRHGEEWKMLIRNAEINDVSVIVELEQDAFAEEAASFEDLKKLIDEADGHTWEVIPNYYTDGEDALVLQIDLVLEWKTSIYPQDNITREAIFIRKL